MGEPTSCSTPAQGSPTPHRRAGVLLHPTSLPGPYGIGDIGPAARQWLEWLESAGQRIWQFLPLGPVDRSGCPYTSPSALALSPLLLSPDDLVRDGWLRASERPFVDGTPDAVHFSRVLASRRPVFEAIGARVAVERPWTEWLAAHPWAEDWALYAALEEIHGGGWPAWPEPLRHRDPGALDTARDAHAARMDMHLALQWLLDGQWRALRADAARRGVALWGDVPFYVAGGGCDTWVHRALFRMDADGAQPVVAGVPPDAFAPTGQRWGNPLYDEAAMAADGYRWWCARIAGLLDWVDAVRIDHFRGVLACWEIPATSDTATEGRWVPGPGRPLFEALQAHLGSLPLIAEDLGLITPDVDALRTELGLPGMTVLQFAFHDAHADGAHAYLPHNHTPDRVVYTGTHDNDTARGWYAHADARTQDHVRRYLGRDGSDIAWDLIRAAHQSVAQTAIVPFQDVLSLHSDARMNTPGVAEGNWRWRVRTEALNPFVAARLAESTRLGGR